LSRSPSWWRLRRVGDPDWLRAGRAALQRVLLEIDGRPAAYAIYRHIAAPQLRVPVGTLEVSEVMGDSPQAAAAIFRYLLDIDLVSRVKVQFLPVDHPLVFLAAEPRRLQMLLSDGLWVRLVDVGAALSARGYGPGEAIVLEVKDAFCPWNEGRYRLDG